MMIIILVSTAVCAASTTRILSSAQSMSANNFNSSLSKLKQDHVFIFFYSSSCLHCTNFSPVLKKYSRNSGIVVRALAINGEPSNQVISSFSGSAIASQEIINRFFGVGAKLAVPALFILNKNNYHAYPVSSGALTYLELDARMNDLTPKILQHENNKVG